MWVYMGIYVHMDIYGYIWLYVDIYYYIYIYIYVSFWKVVIILNLWQRDCSTLPPDVGAFGSDTPHC